MKTTVSVIKADIGSVSGHCFAHPELRYLKRLLCFPLWG